MHKWWSLILVQLPQMDQFEREVLAPANLKQFDTSQCTAELQGDHSTTIPHLVTPRPRQTCSQFSICPSLRGGSTRDFRRSFGGKPCGYV